MRRLALSMFVLTTASTLWAQRPMTYEDILGLKRPSDPQMSPDGSRIVFVVEEWNREEDSYNQDLYLLSLPGGDLARLTYQPKNDSHPRWNPKSNSVAFLSERDDDEPQILLLSFPGGEPRQLTRHKKSVESFAWSSDGETIFFVAPVPDEQDDEKEQKTKKVIVVDEEPPFAHIWKLDVASGTTTQLTQGEFHVVEIDPSPVGGSIAFIRQATPKIADLLSRELCVVSLDGGEPQLMTRNGYAEIRPRFSPNGNRIAYLSEADGNPSAGPSRIHVMSATGGEPTVLARDFDGYIREYDWLPDGKTIQLSADLGVHRQIYQLSVDAGAGAAPEALTQGDGLYGPFSLNSQANAMAFLHEDPEKPGDVWIAKDGYEPEKLTDLNPQSLEWALGKVETIRWTSTDGMAIEGLLVYPLEYQPGRSYPAVLQVHGGPEGAHTREFMANWANFPHVYAAAGYMTLMPNFRGSSNYGAALAQANKGDVGGGDYQDCMTGVDYLVAKGLADPERLAIKGWSYGGYMSGWVIGQTDRFKVAAYGAGVANSVSYYGTADIRWNRENLHGKNPYVNRERWIQQSPLSYVQNVKTPALIFHGEKDERIPVGQSHEFYLGLKEHRVPTKLVIYPEQGHGLKVPSYQLDKMKREFAWIEQYVKGAASTTSSGR